MLQRLPIRLYDWLASTDPVRRQDLIFVLAGRQHRKKDALKLFSSGFGSQLLVSVGRFEIRRFADLALPSPVNLVKAAAAVSPPDRHFFVCFGDENPRVRLVRRGTLGTLSEIQALKAWLAGHPEIRSVLIISSPAHLRRVRLCCRSVLPTTVEWRFVASQEGCSSVSRESWWRDRKERQTVLLEFPKLLLYWAVLRLGIARHLPARNRVIAMSTNTRPDSEPVWS